MTSSSLPFASEYHVPIMVDEVLELIAAAPGKRFVDGTLGGGGHSEALLTATSPDGRLISLDRDPEAIATASARLAPFGDRFLAVQRNYDQMRHVLDELHIAHVDGTLIDAGVSSHQLDAPHRGFSFRHEGPLDMRMGEDTRSLAELLETLDAEQLTQIIRDYGELKGAFRIANGILDAFHAGTLTSTRALHDVVLASMNPALMRKLNVSPATLVFQALRIAVNDELAHLERALHAAVSCVSPGGRVVFICFHSLEDRIIKQGLRKLENPCTCPPALPRCACGKKPKVRILTSKPRRASPEECEANPRARSAVLRAAEIL